VGKIAKKREHFQKKHKRLEYLRVKGREAVETPTRKKRIQGKILGDRPENIL